MNLERVLPAFFFLSVGIGALIGYLLGEAAVRGMAIGMVVGVSPILMLGGTYGFIMWWCPDTPKCMCGNGKSSDYKHLSHLSKHRDEVYCHKCRKCGREYLLQKRRFDLRVTENDIRPYMVISRWGRWRRNDN